MGAIDYYTCQGCGSNISFDNIFFYYDEESQETIDFRHLFTTVGIDYASKIKGRINITYCRHCQKTLKIYIIEECEIENPIGLVYNGIFNHISADKMEIEKLRQIGKRKKCTIISRYSSYVVTFPEYHNRSYSVYTRYEKKAKLVAFLRFRSAIRSSISGRRKQYENDLNSIYLILDERDRTRQDYNPLETVLCPQCSNEVYKWINDKTLCPKCGGRLLFEGGADYD